MDLGDPNADVAAAPGNPDIPTRRAADISKLRKSLGWLLTGPSFFETHSLLVVSPLLFLPCADLVNNALEEVFSWVYGKFDECPLKPLSIRDLFCLPLAMLERFNVVFERCMRTFDTLCQWLSYANGMTGRDMVNMNHALISYVQGLSYYQNMGEHLQRFPTPDPGSRINALVLAVCANLVYERYQVSQGIVSSAHWAPYARWIAGYSFDEVVFFRGNRFKAEEAEVDTNAILVCIHATPDGAAPTAGGQGAPRALVLSFRGTEPLDAEDWLTDFDALPPDDGRDWPFGRIHRGFRRGLGLARDLQSADNDDCICRYLLHEGDRTRRLPPPPKVRANDTFEDGTSVDVQGRVFDHHRHVGDNACAHEKAFLKTSPFLVLAERVEEELRRNPEVKLYITGHSLGGALANLFTAALLRRWKVNKTFPASRLGALYTFGQPRVGDEKYCATLADLMQTSDGTCRYLRVVNRLDIVPRVPPIIDNSYYHGGNLVLLGTVYLRPGCDSAQYAHVQPPITQASALFHGSWKALYGLCYWWTGTNGETLLRASSRILAVICIPLMLAMLIPALLMAAVVSAATIILAPLAPLLLLCAVACMAYAWCMRGGLGGLVPISDHAMSDYIEGIRNSRDHVWVRAGRMFGMRADTNTTTTTTTPKPPIAGSRVLYALAGLAGAAVLVAGPLLGHYMYI